MSGWGMGDGDVDLGGELGASVRIALDSHPVFLWLNASASMHLLKRSGFNMAEMDLITKNGRFHNSQGARQARNQLIQLLSLTKAQARQCTIKGCLTVEVEYLRSAGVPAKGLPHRSLPTARPDALPLHNSNLTERCPHCAASLPMDFKRYSAFFSFACAECGSSFGSRSAPRSSRSGDVSALRRPGES